MSIGTFSLARFQRAPINLLRENGEIVNAEGAAAGPSPISELTISRALCRFQFYRAPTGLPARDLEKAARLKAESEAPFADTGMLILRAPGGASLWFWDQAQIAIISRRAANLLGRVVPESLHRGAGEGWRIIEVSEGFEAQCWREGALIASTWRRRAFTPEQWRAFTLSVEDSGAEAPIEPPRVEHPALEASNAWKRLRVGAGWSWARAEQLARTMALCLFGVAAFAFGAAMHFDRITQQDQTLTHQIEARIAADADMRRAKSRMDLIEVYRRRLANPNVFVVAADAIEVLHGFGIDAMNWSVDGDDVDISLPYVSGGQMPLHNIIGQLENSPHLRDVKVDFEAGGQSVVISAKVEGRR